MTANEDDLGLVNPIVQQTSGEGVTVETIATILGMDVARVRAALIELSHEKMVRRKRGPDGRLDHWVPFEWG